MEQLKKNMTGNLSILDPQLKPLVTLGARTEVDELPDSNLLITFWGPKNIFDKFLICAIDFKDIPLCPDMDIFANSLHESMRQETGAVLGMLHHRNQQVFFPASIRFLPPMMWHLLRLLLYRDKYGPVSVSFSFTRNLTLWQSAAHFKFLHGQQQFAPLIHSVTSHQGTNLISFVRKSWCLDSLVPVVSPPQRSSTPMDNENATSSMFQWCLSWVP